MDGCCQYFPTLTQGDLDTINGHNKLMIVLNCLSNLPMLKTPDKQHEI